MINIRYFNKSIYTIIVFLTITIFSALSISTFQSILTDNITNGNYKSESAKSFNLIGVDKISKEDFIKSVESTPNIYIEKNSLNPGAYSGKAIYFTEAQKVIPNMISGKYFTRDNITSNEPVAIVGKDVAKDAKEKNGEKYFEYENVEYKIIGVMGYENRSSVCDLQFIINLNSYIKNTPISLSESNYLIDSVDANETFNIFIEKLKNIDSEINYELLPINGSKTLMNSILSEGLNIFALFAVMIFLIFINVFNITLQWIERKKKAIGIKKALGGTNFKISCEIIGEYQILALGSFLLGTFLYIAIIKLKVISIFNADIYLVSTLLTFIFSSLIALIVSILAIIKALKIPPSIIMKGGRI